MQLLHLKRKPGKGVERKAGRPLRLILTRSMYFGSQCHSSLKLFPILVKFPAPLRSLFLQLFCAFGSNMPKPRIQIIRLVTDSSGMRIFLPRAFTLRSIPFHQLFKNLPVHIEIASRSGGTSNLFQQSLPRGNRVCNVFSGLVPEHRVQLRLNAPRSGANIVNGIDTRLRPLFPRNAQLQILPEFRDQLA